MKNKFIVFLAFLTSAFYIPKSYAQTNTLTDVQSSIGSASSGWLWNPTQTDLNHFFDVLNTTRTGLQRVGFNMSKEEAIYDYAANNGSLNFTQLDIWCQAAAPRNILLNCHVDYYWTDGVWGRHTNPVASYNWYNIGRNLALRYAPNSSWWTSQGISNYGLTTYTLFNEPDLYNGGDGITDGPKTISSTDYHNALEQFANGIHSVSSTLQVFPGGWAWKDQNNNAYPSYIMDLIGNGTLNGINQHMYVGDYPWEIDNFNNYSWTSQGMYQFFVNQYNLPASTKFITDETNVNANVPNADSRFCSYIWNTLGITNANGQPAFGKVCDVYSVFEGESEANLSLCWNGSTNVQDPWLGNGRGRCLQMISNLTTGMNFTSVDARRTFGGATTGTGKYILDGGGMRLWVWHNKANWTDANGTSFTCTGIPAGTVKIDVYRYNSCSQTVGTTGTLVPYVTANISGQISHTFTGLPTDETLMFKSNTGCTPTAITPYIQVNDGAWTQTSSVTVASGAKVVLGPLPNVDGSWSWSGGGTSGTNREQTIYPTSSGTATATYTNTSGCISTQAHTITLGGAWTIIDDAATGWTWGSYVNDPCATCYNGTSHSVNATNKSCSRTFTGTDVEAYCETFNGAGSVKVYIDNVLKGTYSQNVTPYGGAVKFATITGLTNASHTIKFTTTSTNWVGIDYIRVAVNPLKSAQIPTGIDNPSDSPIKVYPNPVSDFVTIDFTDSQKPELALINIVDLAGKKVYESSETAASVKISTAHFPKGVYILNIIQGKEIYKSKLIIN